MREKTAASTDAPLLRLTREFPMKKVNLLKIAALALAIVCTMAACDNGSTGNGGDNNPGGGISVPGNTLAEKLAWIRNNAQSNTTYNLIVNADEDFAGSNITGTIADNNYLYSAGKTNITLKLTGSGGRRTIRLLSNGMLFHIMSGVTLVLGDNITLQGKSDNNTQLVIVSGSLIMEEGAKISGNYAITGSAVFVPTGTFTMNGGEISGNTEGGVRVDGPFTMNGGKISGNYASLYGGGVLIYGGTLTMNGGEISGNSGSSFGGGVYVNSGTFAMNGGEISGNSATGAYGYGGGVYVFGGTFRISNGAVYGSDEGKANTANQWAALYVNQGISVPSQGIGNGTAQYGTFNGGTWNSNGNLTTTDNTIRVVNGLLQ
jgi:hypothetical protein